MTTAKDMRWARPSCRANTFLSKPLPEVSHSIHGYLTMRTVEGFGS